MEIRIRSTGQVLLDHEWIKWVAMTYGKSVGPLSPEVIEMFDSDPVFEGPQAQPTRYQVAFRDGVEQDAEGRWFTKYSVADMDAEAIAATDAAQAQNVRADRTRRLSECDWTQLADSPVDKTVWAAYRQALRDVPTQSGFPWAVNWPAQPE